METKQILNKIYEFCSVREERQYVKEYSNRLKYLINLVEELNIPYFIDNWDYEYEEGLFFHNLVLPGNSDKLIIAHHDVANFNSDNANDNSASVINAIALKTLRPDLNVIITDSEEDNNCEGAKRITELKYLKEDKLSFIKNIKWILNLELTGYGENITISKFGGELSNLITEHNQVFEKQLPYCETNRIVRKGIDSEVVALYPMIDGKPNFDHFKEIHSEKDSLDKINIDDMYNFVMNFLSKL